jgi:hypothetical protein
MKVLGLAASAASIIAMAGDEIQISRAGFLMVHDTWVVAMGNRNDLRDIADQLEPFDFAMADIYAARTGIDAKTVMKKMDAETWINGSAAVDEGWADALCRPTPCARTRRRRAASAPPHISSTLRSRRRACREASAARSYRITRPARRTLLTAADTPRAVDNSTPSAAAEVEVLNVLASFQLPKELTMKPKRILNVPGVLRARRSVLPHDPHRV